MSALSKADIVMPAKPYTLRHCFEPLMLQVGSDISRVQDLLGHANVATIVDTMESQVRGIWYVTARAAGVSESDFERIASARSYLSFRQKQEA